MKTRVCIRFWFRRTKKVADESAAARGIPVVPAEKGDIYCRITVSGKKVNFTTNGQSVAYNEWNAAAQRVNGKSRSAATTNAGLVKMQD